MQIQQSRPKLSQDGANSHFKFGFVPPVIGQI